MMLEYLFVFCVGAILGSFLNVVGLRFLREESLVFPNSYCYQCKERIKPYDNIPILSWLLLKGKCRKCKAQISWQYPAIELLTGLLFVATVHQFGWSLASLLIMYLICNLMVILITDFREQYIFDINSLGLIPFGLTYAFLNLSHMNGDNTFNLGGLTTITLSHSMMSSLAAVLGAFLLFFTLNLLSRLMVGKPGFGEGDTRLLMGIGSFFGVQFMGLVFVLSFILQSAVGIPMLIRQWVIHKAYKTLGFLVGGFVLAAIPYVLQPWIKDSLVLLLLALGFGGVAMWMAMKSLKSAKDLPMGLTYLPFGPSIVFACLILLFGRDYVMSLFS